MKDVLDDYATWLVFPLSIDRFLFTFDQTELYNKPDLAHAFGIVLSRLRREVLNHVSVVTYNETHWERGIYKYFELADKHALAPESLYLRGMKRDEAKELLLNRLGTSDKSGKE